ncbi:MAG: hypothetical protein PHQ12_02440 [Chthoniobacteraceae bacterium]|nr:hypothetical protein [Chthoniobacteraceae bacterium]
MMIPSSKLSKTFFGAALALCLSLSALHGQSEPANRLPSGPLIAARAPDFAQWDVECRSATGDKTHNASGTPHIAQVTVIKTGEIQYEKTTYGDGTAKERWTKGSFNAVKEPGYRGIIIRPRLEQGGDFPDFDWVSAENYLGRTRMDSRDCIVFRQQMYPLRFQDPDFFRALTNGGKGEPGADLGAKVEVTAWIDLATRFPVQLKIGNDLRVYRFSAPPTTPLVLPDAFAKTVSETEKRIQALTRPLSPP